MNTDYTKVEPIDDNELKEITKEALERAKGLLISEHNVMAVALLVSTRKELSVIGLPFKNAAEKGEMYFALAQVAKIGRDMGLVSALIAINDVRYKLTDMKGMTEEQKNELREKGLPMSLEKESHIPGNKVQEALWATLTRPGHEPYGLILKYSRDDDGGYIFEPMEIMDGDDKDGADGPNKLEVNLLYDWYKDSAEEQAA